jgi:hypothetical protein
LESNSSDLGTWLAAAAENYVPKSEELDSSHVPKDTYYTSKFMLQNLPVNCSTKDACFGNERSKFSKLFNNLIN